jgi:16S rRNA G527 N7-methylase RsmG
VVRECGLSAVIHGDRLDRALKRFPPDLRFSFVTSRAVGNPEEWVPSLGRWMEPGGQVALFQSTPEAPSFAEGVQAFALPRGASNFLVTFHVKH